MKVATARKSFTHSPTGKRLRTGDKVPPTDPHMMGELKSNGLVENVRDAPAADTEAAGEELAIAAMTNAVLEPGDSPRVSIQFRDKREAGFFRQTFAAMKASIDERAAERPKPEPRRTGTAPARQTKPAPTPKNGDAPDPALGGPGAGEGSGAGAGDGNQSDDGEIEPIAIGDAGRVLDRESLIDSLIANPPLGGVTTREAFDNLDDDAKASVIAAEVERLAAMSDEDFDTHVASIIGEPGERPAGDNPVDPAAPGGVTSASIAGGPAAGRKPRGNRPAS